MRLRAVPVGWLCAGRAMTSAKTISEWARGMALLRAKKLSKERRIEIARNAANVMHEKRRKAAEEK